jgi:hypothetical protein
MLRCMLQTCLVRFNRDLPLTSKVAPIYIPSPWLTDSAGRSCTGRLWPVQTTPARLSFLSRTILSGHC